MIFFQVCDDNKKKILSNTVVTSLQITDKCSIHSIWVSSLLFGVESEKQNKNQTSNSSGSTNISKIRQGQEWRYVLMTPHGKYMRNFHLWQFKNLPRVKTPTNMATHYLEGAEKEDWRSLPVKWWARFTLEGGAYSAGIFFLRSALDGTMFNYILPWRKTAHFKNVLFILKIQ